jgi:hypothetical protein
MSFWPLFVEIDIFHIISLSSYLFPNIKTVFSNDDVITVSGQDHCNPARFGGKYQLHSPLIWVFKTVNTCVPMQTCLCSKKLGCDGVQTLSTRDKLHWSGRIATVRTTRSASPSDYDAVDNIYNTFIIFFPISSPFFSAKQTLRMILSRQYGYGYGYGFVFPGALQLTGNFNIGVAIMVHPGGHAGDDG